jgi:hypothetical protein
MERISGGKALNAEFLNGPDGGCDRAKKTDSRMAWRVRACVLQARSAGLGDSEPLIRGIDTSGPHRGYIH